MTFFSRPRWQSYIWYVIVSLCGEKHGTGDERWFASSWGHPQTRKGIQCSCGVFILCPKSQSARFPVCMFPCLNAPLCPPVCRLVCQSFDLCLFFLYTSLLTPVFVWLSAYMAFCICLSAQLFSSLECSGFLSLFAIVWLYSTVRLSVSVRRSNLSVSLPLLLLPTRLPDCLVSVCLPAWLLGVWLYVYMYGGKSVGVCVCLTGIMFFFSQAAAEDPYWVSPAYAQ